MSTSEVIVESIAKDSMSGVSLAKYKKALIAIVVCAILLSLAIVYIVFQFLKPAPAMILETKTTDFGFKDIGELTTQSAFYTEILSQESYRQLFNTGFNIPGTKASKIVSFDGIIKAGIDFKDISYSINDDTHTVYITMPEAMILSNELDHNSVKVWSEKLNVFNPTSFEATNEVYRTIENQAKEKAIENDLLLYASNNAKTLIKGMCKSVLPEYEVVFQ